MEIDTALSFRIMGDSERGEDPEHVKNFVHRIQPSGLQSLLTDAQEEAVRGLARALDHTEVYGLRGGGVGSGKSTLLRKAQLEAERLEAEREAERQAVMLEQQKTDTINALRDQRDREGAA